MDRVVLRVLPLGYLERSPSRGGPAGGGALLAARDSQLGPRRLREHAAGQARADVIGSAPRAPGRPGGGGRARSGTRAGTGGGGAAQVARRRGWSPQQSTPKLFLNSRRGPKGSGDSDSEPLLRQRPAPSTLSALLRSKVRAPPARWTPAPAPAARTFSSSGTSRRPGANFSSRRQHKPSPLGLLRRLPPSAGRPRSYVR